MLKDYYKGKRVLVTGHTGFKGAWLCEWLLSLGAKVTGYSDSIPTKPSLYEILNLEKRIADYRADIRDTKALQNSFQETKPEVIFHLAAQSEVLKSYEFPQETFEINVGGTANVLEAIRKHSNVEAAVIVTSDKCYLNHGTGKAFKEDDPLGGKDPYSASKAAAELVVESYRASYFTEGTRVSSARAGNVIGGGDWSENRIVPGCIRAWTAKKPVQLRNPDYTRPWQHVLEPLYGYLLLGMMGDGPYNFGPEEVNQTKVKELVDKMRGVWGNCEWEAAPNATIKESSLLRLSSAKAVENLNWKPLFSLDETVSMTANWYKTFHQKGGESAAMLVRMQMSQATSAI